MYNSVGSATLIASTISGCSAEATREGITGKGGGLYIYSGDCF